MIYNLILLLSLPFAAVVYPFLAVFNPRFRVGLAERLGLWREGNFPGSSGSNVSPPVIWIHSASVGEIQGAWRFIEAVAGRFPDSRLILTTLTASGRRLLEARVPELKKNAGEILIRLFPIDLPYLSALKMERLRPALIVLIETELWPNFLRAAERTGTPVMVANGRISPRSHPGYRRIRWILGAGLRSIRCFLMQSPGDAERIIGLGAPAYRVRAAGNFKFEQRVRALTQEEAAGLRRNWNWGSDDPVWVAGSTHEGEEESVLAAFETLRRDRPALRLILAPRHLERIPAVRDRLAGRRWIYRLLSTDDPENLDPVDIVLVDTLGELGRLYSIADVVFVGGTLVSVGGHNLAEPALLAKPVVFGPELHQVRPTADLLLGAGGGFRVETGTALAEQLGILLGEPERRIEAGRRAADCIRGQQGAVDRAVGAAAGLIGSGAPEGPGSDHRNRLGRWIEKSVWTGRGGAATTVGTGAAVALSGLYRGAVSMRDAGYRFGILRARRLARPVISIGNITVGGTGKTPAVVAACRVLMERGHRPAVLSRGYGGESRAPVLEVSDGSRIKWPARIVGDEPVLIARKVPGVSVWVGADRAEVGRAAVLSYSPDVLLLDDGFQHRRLARDLDIVLLDADRPFGNGRLLPAGPMREPVGHLRRSDAFVLTHAESAWAVEGVADYLESLAPGRPCLMSRHRWNGFVPLSVDESGEAVKPDGFRNRRAYAVCGVARPASFFASLRRADVQLAGSAVFDDHHPYSSADVEGINDLARRCGADLVITTEKDGVRLEPHRAQLARWWAVDMDLAFVRPESWTELILRVV